MIHACSFPTIFLVTVVLLLLTNDTAIRIINNRSAVVVEAFSTTSSSVLSHTPSTQRPQSASRSVLFAADEDAADAAAASDVSIPYDAAARLAFEALGDDTLAFEDYAPTYKAEAIELVKSKGFFASSSSSSTGSAATTAVPETTSVSSIHTVMNEADDLLAKLVVQSIDHSMHTNYFWNKLYDP